MNSPENKKITLWTIQSREAWEKAEQDGILKGDENYVWEDFRQPYQWLSNQMERRIAGFEGGYPVWAWPYIKPDLRHRGHLEPGKAGVRVEFTADPEDVLLSDFDGWHSVLSGTRYSPTELDDDSYFSAWTMSDTDPKRAREIIKSWEQIFDIERLRQYDEEQIVQATLGAVALSQVVSIKHFIAR